MPPRVATAAAVLLAACGGGAPDEPPARAVDTTAIADADLVSAVLDECHRPLRGHLDRIAAIVHLPDGSEVNLFALLPDKLRTAAGSDRFLLVHDDVTRFGEPPQPAPTAAEIATVRRLGTLLDAAALGPLHRARSCRRLGPAEFELAQPAGTPWQLRLRPGTLLPQSLTGPQGEVRILEHLRTSTTWMTKRAELTGLGACTIDFELAGLDWDADFFTLPGTRPPAAAGRPVMQVPVTSGVEPRSPVPVLVDSKAMRWVLLADPGQWPERVADYRPAHAEVERQDQQIAGFPLFFREGGQRWFALPFRRRPGGTAFAPPADWSIREVPAGRWLVVYPPTGELDARITTGESLLQDALTQLGLQAAGPITAQPFFHLHEGEPPVAKLQNPVVRVAVLVK